MFITPAFAQATGGPDGGFLIQMVPFVLIFIILYFLIIRPQQRRAKEHKAMIEAVRRGDTVVTSGGLIGKVAKVIDENEISIEIAPDVKVKISRGAIGEVRSKGEPVKEEKAEKAEKPAKAKTTKPKSAVEKAKSAVEKVTKAKKTK